MELYSWSGQPRSGAKKAAILVIAILSIAATTRVIIDVMKWREMGLITRRIAADERAGPRERIDAIVSLQRDMRETVRVLRDIAEKDGPMQAQALNALRSVGLGPR